MGESPWKFESSWPHQAVLNAPFGLTFHWHSTLNPAKLRASEGTVAGPAVRDSQHLRLHGKNKGRISTASFSDCNRDLAGSAKAEHPALVSPGYRKVRGHQSLAVENGGLRAIYDSCDDFGREARQFDQLTKPCPASAMLRCYCCQRFFWMLG